MILYQQPSYYCYFIYYNLFLSYERRDYFKISTKQKIQSSVIPEYNIEDIAYIVKTFLKDRVKEEGVAKVQ